MKSISKNHSQVSGDLELRLHKIIYNLRHQNHDV